MESARWDQIQAVFHAVADLPEPDRHAAVQTACGEDSGLAADVLALLEEDAHRASLIDRDLGDLAHRTLDPSFATHHLDAFGPYRVRAVLGEGGMGVVYLAERRDLGSLVAIKVLRDAWLSPARRERFESEQRTLAQLNHPNIALLFDAGILDDGTPWFVMEYVEGVPLTDYCGRHECSIDERLRLFRSVCEAVEYAHTRAIIHRDLKPSNILVKDNGAVKLLDFGIAKQIESLEEGADRTRTVRFMTPAYAAPEQISGGRADTRSDVYSLGVILYELLAGRLPFDLSKRPPAGAEPPAARREAEKPSAAAAKYRPALRTGKAAWKDLDVLCLTAMREEGERRYPSIEALTRDIDHYLKGEPLEARPDSLSYRAGKFITRNWRGVAATAIVVAVIVAQLVFFTVRLTRARNAALTQAARTQRVQQFMLNLFGGGDKTAGPSQELQVVALIDRGAQEARTLDKEPEVQAELYLTLGIMYEKLGKFDRADTLLESARKIRESITGQDSVETAESLVALSQLRADQSQYQEAERLARQAVAIENRRLPRESPSRARAESQLGEALKGEGKFDEASPLLEDCVRIESAPGGIPAELSQCLKDLAVVRALTNQYGLAKSMEERAMEIDRNVYGPAHPNIAQELSDLADFDNALGNYDEAEKYMRQSIEIDQAWYGAANPETAAQTERLAQTLTTEGKFDEAEPFAQQAFSVLSRAYGDSNPKVAVVLNDLVAIDEHNGRWGKAKDEMIRIVEIDRSTLGEDNYQTTVVEANLGHLYLERKEYARAEKIYRDAIPVVVREFAPEHPNVGIVQIDLGRVLLRERRYKEAEEHTSEGYRILAKQASPSMKFMKMAYEDLAAEYGALHQPEKAKQFQAELAAMRQ